MSPTSSAPAASSLVNPRRAVPILLAVFLFSLIIDNGFKFMSLPISQDLGLSATEVSLQASLAGIVIGIGGVVYSALADSFNIRTLLIVGIIFVAVGSIIGFVGQAVWPVVVAARVIQTMGLSAAETLYVIYVTKHMAEKEQKTYLGFSTASFQLSFLFGTLTSGIIATYIAWPVMFLVALLAVLAIPVIIRQVPPEETTSSHIDGLGLVCITVMAASLVMWTQAFNHLWLIPALLGIIAFAARVIYSENALVRPDFFNGRYASSLVVVFLVYFTQLGLTSVIFPFALHYLHGFELDATAYLLAPGYFVGALAGVFAGAVGRVLSSRRTMMLALAIIFGALTVCALAINSSVVVLSIAVMFYSAGFATMYAPLMNGALSHMPAKKRGVAVGFYNLTINIAVPLGFQFSGTLVNLLPHTLGLDENSASLFSTILAILAGIVAVGAVVYFTTDAILSRAERRRGEVPATGA